MDFEQNGFGGEFLDKAIKKIVFDLPDLERIIIYDFYYRGKKQYQIAKDLTLSQGLISQKKKGALEIIKEKAEILIN